MSTENAEIIQTEPVAPAPVTPETATAPVAAPVENPAEVANHKQTQAFIKQRQEVRDLKRKLAEVTANNAPPPTPVTEQATATVKEVPSAPAPIMAENSIEEDGTKAIMAMSGEADVKSIPGAVIDILDMIDTDPRLAKLYKIDATIALREAKGIYLSKMGVGPSPAIPKSTATSGGMGGGKKDLGALIAKCESLTPGTKEYADAAKAVDAEMNRLN